MGADIHAVVQVRDGDTWKIVNTPAEMLDCGEAPWELRNYTLFGVLAGVRDHDVTPIAEPRGLPDDLEIDPDSDRADPCLGGHWLGEHSHSWVTVAELAAYDLSEQYAPWGTVGDASGIPRWLPYLLSLGKPEDVRLVFGFDS